MCERVPYCCCCSRHLGLRLLLLLEHRTVLLLLLLLCYDVICTSHTPESEPLSYNLTQPSQFSRHFELVTNNLYNKPRALRP